MYYDFNGYPIHIPDQISGLGGISVVRSGQVNLISAAAAGSTISNAITGAGGVTYIPKFISSSGLTNSNILHEDTHKIAIMSGSNAQSLAIYNSYVSSTINEYAYNRWTGNVYEIGNYVSGNTGRDINLTAGTNLNLLSRSGITGVIISGTNINIKGALTTTSGITSSGLTNNGTLTFSPSGFNNSPITFGNNTYYIYNGIVPCTGNLPSISSCTGRIYRIKNRGNSLQITGASSTDLIFNTSAVLSFTINSGEAYELINDGTFWSVF